MLGIKKILTAIQRSFKWRSTRTMHLEANPTCAACGGTKKLEVHHVVPFHTRPELELDLGNLITLCESKNNGVNCHLFFGHAGSYKSFNPAVREDAQTWKRKITERP